MNSHNNKLEFTRNISNNIDRVLLFHELESRKFEREEWENQYHKTNPYRTEMNVNASQKRKAWRTYNTITILKDTQCRAGLKNGINSGAPVDMKTSRTSVKMQFFL